MDTKLIHVTYDLYGEILEFTAEIPANVPPAWTQDAQLKIVGKGIPRIDGYQKVSGDAKYAHDYLLPHVLFGRLLTSPHAHARIKSIDTSEAESLDGVRYILTHKNTPRLNWPWGGEVFPVTLHYEGAIVAAVAADSEMIAEDAIRRIKVEYEKLPFVIDAEKAMKSNAPNVVEEGIRIRGESFQYYRENPAKGLSEANIIGGKAREYSRGNIENGFQEADIIIEENFRTAVLNHAPTERHICTVNWEGDDLTVWDSTQYVFRTRDHIAAGLNIPQNKVRVIKDHMGGGFGSKLRFERTGLIAPVLAKETGRPVQMTMTRKEDFLATGNRPGTVQRLKAGIMKDGTITAVDVSSCGPVGAYWESANVSGPFRLFYRIPNLHIEYFSVRVNTGNARAMRAPGFPPAVFSLESMMDMLAEQVGMDPLEFRLKNYAETDPQSGNPYSTKLLRECYAAGARAVGWKNSWTKPGSDTGRFRRGLGMATGQWWGVGRPPTYATVKVNADGTTAVLCGTQDIGTGTKTIIAQVAAEVLQIDYRNVRVVVGDTESCPFGTVSGGSLTAASSLPAVRTAAVEVKKKLTAIAADMLKVPPENVEMKDGIFRVGKDPENHVTYTQVAGKMGNNMIVETAGREDNTDEYALQAWSAQFAEVEVDTYTGNIKVLKVVAACDIGRVVNPLTLENQVQGGIMMGLGMTLMEERILDDRTGRMVNPNMHAYLMPTAMDTPQMEVIVVSKSDPHFNNVGVKGVGELAIVPTTGAIANAVYNAIGVRLTSLPMTPDKVIRALQQSS